LAKIRAVRFSYFTVELSSMKKGPKSCEALSAAAGKADSNQFNSIQFNSIQERGL
jgi:hypothetical protein